MLFMDAQAIVRICGKPDLFITMTCNPLWTEIKRELLPGQAPADRPDIIARVFRQKLRQFVHAITVDHIFGVPAAWLWVVEFQKRGLPHVHALIILREQDKPRTEADIDHIVSAEIPCPTKNPTLHNIVIKNMIHGPHENGVNHRMPCVLKSRVSALLCFTLSPTVQSHI